MIKKTRKWGHNGIDFIGDVHGFATALRCLLAELGYDRSADGFCHPDGRKVVFLGDYIDRGLEVRETLSIVRSMVDSGNAMALMGNHEYNAVCFHIPDGKGDFLRSHTVSDGKNVKQHQSTLDQFSGSPEEWREWITWFRALPFFIDFGEWRAVHATWDHVSIRNLGGASLLDDTFLRNSAIKGTPEYSAIETVLKGVEVALPEGVLFEDHAGYLRSGIRVRWWKDLQDNNYRNIVFPASERVPDERADIAGAEAWEPYHSGEVPVFFGHYWIPPETVPAPMAPNVACLDYSVAVEHGKLTAYCWDGESVLCPEGFVQVKSLKEKTGKEKTTTVMGKEEAGGLQNICREENSGQSGPC